MSNAKTGLAAAAGALIGGALGATAGFYAQRSRPRHRYGSTEDAMVVGGAAGATLGAFIGATVAGEEPPPELPIKAG